MGLVAVSEDKVSPAFEMELPEIGQRVSVALLDGRPLEDTGLFSPRIKDSTNAAKPEVKVTPSWVSLIGDFSVNSQEVLSSMLANLSALRPKEPIQAKIRNLIQDEKVWLRVVNPNLEYEKLLFGVSPCEEVVKALKDDKLLDSLLPGLRDILDRCKNGSFSCAEKTLLRSRFVDGTSLQVRDKEEQEDDPEGPNQKKTVSKDKKKKKKTHKPKFVSMEMGQSGKGEAKADSIDDWYLDKVHIPIIKLNSTILSSDFIDWRMAVALLSGCSYELNGIVGRFISHSEISSKVTADLGQVQLILQELKDLGLCRESEEQGINVIKSELPTCWSTLLGIPTSFQDGDDAAYHYRRLTIAASNLTSKSEYKGRLTSKATQVCRLEMNIPQLTPNDEERGAFPLVTGEELFQGKSQYTNAVANATLDQRRNKAAAMALIEEHLEELAKDQVDQPTVPFVEQQEQSGRLSHEELSTLMLSKGVVPLLNPAADPIKRGLKDFGRVGLYYGLYPKAADEEFMTEMTFMPEFGMWAGLPSESAFIFPCKSKGEIRLFSRKVWRERKLKGLYRKSGFTDDNAYFQLVIEQPIDYLGKSRHYTIGLYLPVPYREVVPFETETLFNSPINGLAPITHLFCPTSRSSTLGKKSNIWPLRPIRIQTNLGGRSVKGISWSIDLNVEVGVRGMNLGFLSTIARTDVQWVFPNSCGEEGFHNKFFIEMGCIYISLDKGDFVYTGPLGLSSLYSNVVMKIEEVFPDAEFPMWLPVTATCQQRQESFNINAGKIGDDLVWTLNSLGDYTIYKSTEVPELTEGTSATVHPICCKTSPLVAEGIKGNYSVDRRIQNRIWPEFQPKSVFASSGWDSSCGYTMDCEMENDSNEDWITDRSGKGFSVGPKGEVMVLLKHDNISNFFKEHYLIYATTPAWEMHGSPVFTNSPPFTPVKSTNLPQWDCTLTGKLSTKKPLTVEHHAKVHAKVNGKVVDSDFDFEITESTTWDCAHEGIQNLIEVLPLSWFTLVGLNGMEVACVGKSAEHVNATALSPPRDGKFLYIFPPYCQPGSERFKTEFGADLEKLFLDRQDYLISADTPEYSRGKARVVIAGEHKLAWELAIEIKTSSAEKLAFYRYCHKPIYQKEGLGAFVIGSYSSMTSKGLERVWAFPFLGSVGNALIQIRQRDLASKMRARVTFGGNQALKRNGKKYKDWYRTRSQEENSDQDYLKKKKELYWDNTGKELSLIEELYGALIKMLLNGKLEVGETEVVYHDDSKGLKTVVAQVPTSLSNRLKIWINRYQELKKYYDIYCQTKDHVEGLVLAGDLSEVWGKDLKPWDDMFVPVYYLACLLRPSFTWSEKVTEFVPSGDLEEDLCAIVKHMVAKKSDMGRVLEVDECPYSPLKDEEGQRSAYSPDSSQELEDDELEEQDDEEWGDDEEGVVLKGYETGVVGELIRDLHQKEGEEGEPDSSDDEDDDEGKSRGDGPSDSDLIPRGPSYDKNAKSVVLTQKSLDKPAYRVDKVLEVAMTQLGEVQAKVKKIGKLKYCEYLSALPPFRITNCSPRKVTLPSGPTVKMSCLVKIPDKTRVVKTVISSDIWGILAYVKFIRNSFKVPWLPKDPSVPLSLPNEINPWVGKRRVTLGVGKLKDTKCLHAERLPSRTENYCFMFYSVLWWIVPLEMACRSHNYIEVSSLARLVGKLLFDASGSDKLTGLDLALSCLITGKVMHWSGFRAAMLLLRSLNCIWKMNFRTYAEIYENLRKGDKSRMKLAKDEFKLSDDDIVRLMSYPMQERFVKVVQLLYSYCSGKEDTKDETVMPESYTPAEIDQGIIHFNYNTKRTLSPSERFFNVVDLMTGDNPVIKYSYAIMTF